MPISRNITVVDGTLKLVTGMLMLETKCNSIAMDSVSQPDSGPDTSLILVRILQRDEPNTELFGVGKVAYNTERPFPFAESKQR